MAPDERFAVVVYGATGVTGRQVAHRLGARAGRTPGFRWAIAGRNRDRLEELRRQLPAGVEVVVAGARDDPQLAGLVAGTRVVLNMAGPYALSSDALVRECARRGVDYVDVTGETPHVRRLIDRYHALAASTGARIVPFCGFDSFPSDLGTLLLVEHFRTRGQATREVKGFFRAFGSLNPGTVATTLALWRRPEDLRAMDDPLLLCPEDQRGGGRCRPCDLDPAAPEFDPDLGRWVAPFFMGPINTRVVRRSRSLAAGWGKEYGWDFRYQEYWDPGGPVPLVPACAVAWSLSMYRTLSRAQGAAEMLAPFALAPHPYGTRPPDAQDFFRAVFVGTAADGAKAWAEISGPGDPSNGATATIVCECALLLSLERERLPGGNGRGGLLTPATALGLPLAERLRSAGITVKCPA